MKRLIAAGAQLRTFPREVMDLCYGYAQELYADWSAKYPEFKRIYTSYNSYLGDQLDWFRVADGTFDNYMASTRRGARR
jgi:TRAP-type mannitol/chloroaromatic compound transport system substrate-binding protein